MFFKSSFNHISTRNLFVTPGEELFADPIYKSYTCFFLDPGLIKDLKNNEKYILYVSAGLQKKWHKFM